MTLLAGKWTVRLTMVILCALVVISITYWASRLFTEQALPTVVPHVETTVLIDTANVSRILGSKPSTIATRASLSSRFVLRGVLAGAPGGGAALISVDGKPAQPIRVGAIIADNFVLQSVVGRTAVLATGNEGESLVTLEMPTLKTP